MPPLPCHTTALTLRHFVPQDAQALLLLNGEPTTRRWLPSHVYADLAGAQAAVASLIAWYSAPGDARLGPYVLGVELDQTKQLLGHVGFSPLRGEVEISYAIAEAFRGRGLARQAVVAACRWAAQAFELPSLVANTASANVASRRLLDRAGFVHGGDRRTRFQGDDEVDVSRYTWSPRR